MPPFPFCALLAAAAAATVATTCHAQRKWQLPEGGAALYQRENATRVEPIDPVNAGITFHDGCPPLLLESDLDESHRRPTKGVHFFFELAAAIAFDLSLSADKTSERRFPSISKVGDVTAQVIALPITPVTGQPQEGTKLVRESFQVALKDAPEHGTDKDLTELLKFYHAGTVDGTIRIERCFDPARGLVTSFAATYNVEFTQNMTTGTHRSRLVDTERWTLAEVATGPGRRHDLRVADAARRATKELENRLQSDNGAWLAPETPGPAQGPALHAYYLRALAHVGSDPKILQESLEALLKRRFRHTRALTESLLAVCAVHAHAVSKRRLPRDLRNHATRLVTALSRARDPRPKTGHLAYSHIAGRGDGPEWIARAVEAMLAARAMGLRIPRNFWREAARSLIASQSQPNADRTKWLANGAVTYSHEIAGWQTGKYAGARPHGFPTAAAVAALSGLRAHLPVRDKKLHASVDAAIHRGLGWLAVHFTPRTNPSLVSNDRQMQADWTEWLPIAMQREGVKRLAGRDWQFELALCLTWRGKELTLPYRRCIGGLPGALVGALDDSEGR